MCRTKRAGGDFRAAEDALTYGELHAARHEDALEFARERSELRGIAHGLVDVVAFCCALRERERGPAMGALERVMDELVAFDARCAAGDVDGAVVALRAWLWKVRG